MTTQQFILEHREDNVSQLALKGCSHADLDMQWALQQIAGYQQAKEKLPSWAANSEIIYPPHLNMEQCSSERTAMYKVDVMKRLIGKGSVLTDLTGGYGVDCAFLSQLFEEVHYVEQSDTLCQTVSHNFAALKLNHVSIHNDTAEKYLEKTASTQQAKSSTLIFIDPARRSESGKRTFAIADCTPNVLELKERLLDNADVVMVKLSPMLDWHLAVEQMNTQRACVSEVHIVAVKNECKELLLVLREQPSAPLTLYCTNDNHTEKFVDPLNNRQQTASTYLQSAHTHRFLYEPNASIMKGGCFQELAERYGVVPASAQSHLFFSTKHMNDFPGRSFVVEKVFSMNKKELKTALKDIVQANITVRNFPLSAVALRQRLKLKDGGSHYLFATTLDEGKKVLFLCKKKR